VCTAHREQVREPALAKGLIVCPAQIVLTEHQRAGHALHAVAERGLDASSYVASGAVDERRRAKGRSHHLERVDGAAQHAALARGQRPWIGQVEIPERAHLPQVGHCRELVATSQRLRGSVQAHLRGLCAHPPLTIELAELRVEAQRATANAGGRRDLAQHRATRRSAQEISNARLLQAEGLEHLAAAAPADDDRQQRRDALPRGELCPEGEQTEQRGRERRSGGDTRGSAEGQTRDGDEHRVRPKAPRLGDGG
jgi:hypothetical protein